MRVLLAVALAVGLALLAPAAPAAARVEPLPVGVDVDYQLGGEDTVPADVGIVVRDRTARPVPGVYDVCYLNAFQTQPGQARFWRRHWPLVLKQQGRPVIDAGWGEWLLDVGTPAKRHRLATIVGRWVAGCAHDGFQGVELDNLDSFTRSRRLLDRADALAFARLLVRRAHAVGLAVGQKNLAGYDGTGLGFDFAVAESCARYAECHRYVRHYGDQVVMVEYRRVDFERACAAYGATHAVVLRDRDLDPSFSPSFC
ncbi:endo alpha-1,4 polygalactosaminidase [Nocardioides rubriscoriae]|uniref:endo alpha-1,4 polygalactosaminidase n=1 Tax=Nocardioides rubriscoriae TaxID=642762 RepID=UPI0011DFBA43|nr:endo alpha-1,4 polygalactosaminidase [Nocardioides rubriscoriae]